MNTLLWISFSFPPSSLLSFFINCGLELELRECASGGVIGG